MPIGAVAAQGESAEKGLPRVCNRLPTQVTEIDMSDETSESPKEHAIKVLANCRIAIGASFKVLAPDQLQPLRRWAQQDRYSPASHALGSPVQSYHAKLQKDAKGQKDLKSQKDLKGK